MGGTCRSNIGFRMGATQVTVAVKYPADSQLGWEGLFRVDTGAID